MLSLKTTCKAEEGSTPKSVMTVKTQLHTLQIVKVIRSFLLKAGRIIQAFPRVGCPVPWDTGCKGERCEELLCSGEASSPGLPPGT